MKTTILRFVFLFIFFPSVFAQNNRISTHEQIGWYNLFTTFRLTDKIGIHTEYQWRRDNYITDWQQSLLRLGINYQLSQGVLFRVGYGWIETFPYGEIPINGLGKDFTEHRIFEMIQLMHKEENSDFMHRFMLEQRFVGRYNSAASSTEDEFPLLNRIRYMFRMQMPLTNTQMTDNTLYAAIYDEVFIGFGENVNANIFDQNRLGLLLGWQFNKNVKIEAGYLNQIIQFGRQINGKNVFQYNSGIIVNANLNIDLRNSF
jgi:hypothetical protein